MGYGFLRSTETDRAVAEQRERDRLAQATAHDQIDPRFRAAMAAIAGRPDAVPLGASVHDPALTVYLLLSGILGVGHGLVTGRTGAGKTRLILLIVRFVVEMLLRMLLGLASAPLLLFEDHKGEGAEAALDLIGAIVDRLPGPLANRLIDALLIIDPFSRQGLVSWNVLAHEPGTDVSEEAQAFEVASMVQRLTAIAGNTQDVDLFHLVLLGICNGLRFDDLVTFASDPAALAAEVARCANAQVRRYFSGGLHMTRASLNGLLARLVRVIRLPNARAMLNARDPLNLRRAIREKLIIANFGNADLGCEDLGRFFGGAFNMEAARAVFAGTPAEAAQKVLWITDEWQEALAGSADAAGHFDRVLTMARSRGVACLLSCQSLSGAANASPQLVRTVLTNVTHACIFATSHDDARSLAHIFPITQRRLRSAPLPWERPHANPYLTPAEETAALIEETSHLPARHFWFLDRTAPYRAQLVRSLDAAIEPPSFLPADTARRIRLGCAGRPMETLIAEARPGTPAAGEAFTPTANPLALRLPSRRPRRRGAG